jgi:hypothetical protein
MVVALLCSLLFGPKTLPLVTLNWQYYSAHGGGWDVVSHRPVIAYIIQLWVMLFPGIFNYYIIINNLFIYLSI